MNTPQQAVEAAIQVILSQFRAGDVQTALHNCEKALATFPEAADLYHVTGNILQAVNAGDRALEMMERAVVQSDANPKYRLELADMYTVRGHLKEAERHCRAYLQTKPDDHIGLNALAAALEAQGDFDGAEAALRKAALVTNGIAGAGITQLNLLAIALRRMGKPNDAIPILQRTLVMAPHSPELHYNIANVYMDAAMPDDAINHYRLSLDIRPDSPDTHLHLAFAYLLKGNLRRGWREMEWRWKIPLFEQTMLPSPRWNGEQVDGTVLLLCEQGFGDSVHFIRYATEVAKRCSRVAVYAPQGLARLLATAPGVDEVGTWDAPPPAHAAYVPMMSLPYVFQTELDTIPAIVPYLSAQAEDVAAWRNILKDLPGAKIGLAWKGNPRNDRERMRAIPTPAVMDMVRSIDASFVCVTKERPEDGGEWPANLHYFGDRLADVADAAALLENLDLVLSIDTLATHLTGALGKKLWTLLAPAADWRYLLEREDSPWYPSARLIRRAKDEDWFQFMARVGNDLKARF